MLLVLLGLSLSLASAQPSLKSSCGNETCRRDPSDAPLSPVTDGERVLNLLLCHLECLDRSGNNEGADFISCRDNCTQSTASTTVPLTPSSPPPQLEPVIVKINNEGLYGISIPNGQGSGDTGSDVMMTGSGNIIPEVYLVRVSLHGNDSYYPMVSQYEVINMAPFACSEVDVSYAVVTGDGSTSKFSPPETICVFIPQEAEAAQNLVVMFEEDILWPQQAIVYLSWDEPSDVGALEGYVLTVTRTVPPGNRVRDEDKNCTEQDPMVYSIDLGQTNFTIFPSQSSRLMSPLYTCTYVIELVSLPGNDGVSKEVEIAYNRPGSIHNRTPLVPVCTKTYIPRAIRYDLAISWTIDDPLVQEAVKKYKLQITPAANTLPVLALANMEIYTAEENQTDFVFVFRVPVLRNSMTLVLEVDPMAPRVGPRDDFYWRRPLIPNKAKCGLDISALPPTPVPSDVITLAMEPISSGVLSFTVNWTQPKYLNGDLVRYELCIGEDNITGSDVCADPSDCLYVERADSSGLSSMVVGCRSLPPFLDQPTANIDYHVATDIQQLFLQIRAVSNFTLAGDWSDPVVLLNTSSPDKPSPPSTGETMTYVIYIVAPVLCVIFMALFILLVVCVCRHFCFHRRIKYDDTFIMDRMRSDYQLPLFIPVADEWEVPSEDVEIFYNDELGHGAFGQVYHGLLHSRELRDLMNGGRRASRKRGSFGKRRSSSKKAVVGSTVVAIKRLRDNIDGPEKANFLKEIEMMKKVSGSNHDHQMFVVNMLGCVTIQEPMMLVLEYASHGDLLTYLRQSRGEDASAIAKAAPYLEPKGAYSQLTPRASGKAAEGEEEEDDKLTAKDLLSFARQIAAGMEFLSSLNVVHRDLACRNVLVCEGRLVKISDFGLSRTLVNQEAYVTTTKGVLPIRWMAPEALFYRTFDTQSDVWSYGILLWEIYTLGGYPYPTMSNRDIVELLTTGYRMEKPELCTNEVYDLMLRCWNPLGLGRPTFLELYFAFDNMLTETTRFQSPYVQLLGACYYDQLGPQVQIDNETINLDEAPANVDVRHLSSSLPEGANGFLGVPDPVLRHSAGTHGQEVRRRPFNEMSTTPRGIQSANRSSSPNRLAPGDYDSNSQQNRDFRPLRPQSWVGTSELGPRYVPSPLHLNSAHSSTSNLTEETTLGSTIVTPEHRQSVTQSRSVGSIPLLTNVTTTVRTTKL